MPVAAGAKGKLSLLRADNAPRWHQVDHSHSSSAGISCVEAVEDSDSWGDTRTFSCISLPLSVTDDVELVYACM